VPKLKQMGQSARKAVSLCVLCLLEVKIQKSKFKKWSLKILHFFSPQRSKGTKEHERKSFALLCTLAPLWRKKTSQSRVSIFDF
jgi:hypothetical protein